MTTIDQVASPPWTHTHTHTHVQKERGRVRVILRPAIITLVDKSCHVHLGMKLAYPD